MDHDADDLLLFASVVDAGRVGGAAERLGLPASTVSRRLAALERRLGEKLLTRTTRRLTLTDFGQAVLEHARNLAAEVEATRALALHRQQRASGRLRVSLPADLAQQLLADMLCRFVADHPAVRLELDLSPRRVDLLAEGFDLAIRMGALPSDASLAARRLGQGFLGLYAAPAYLARHAPVTTPVGLEALHGLMLPGRGGDVLPWRLDAPAQDGGPARSWQGRPRDCTVANAPALLLQMALVGLGVVAASHAAAAPWVREGRLVPLLTDWALPPVDCWAVFPERRLMPLRTRLFIEAVAATLADHPALRGG